MCRSEIMRKADGYSAGGFGLMPFLEQAKLEIV